MSACDDGHIFIVTDERFSNEQSPWVARCACGQQTLVINLDQNNIWSFRMEAGIKEGGE